MTPISLYNVPNGYIVDGQIWRGGQPSNQGIVDLATAGALSILDLNNPPAIAKTQEALAVGRGMKFASLDWSGVLVPSQKQVKEALDILDSFPKPIFVHCQHGSDRTGVVCACWRIHKDGWDWKRAIAEAFSGLGFEGMHEFWMAAAVVEYGESCKVTL